VMIDAMEVAEVIAEFADRQEKTMQVVWLATGKLRGVEAEKFLKAKKIPMYDMPLDAARALKFVTDYWEWRKKPVGKVIEHKVDTEKARKIIANCRKEERLSLNDHEAMELMSVYKLPTLKSISTQTRDEALAAAQEIGYPVVLKASRPGLLHKTDVGGVQLDISGPTELMEAWGNIDANLKKHKMRDGASLLVQPMVQSDEKGVECVLGLRNLKKYGPMIMFGLGGIYVEILKAVMFRMVPLTDEDARELVVQSPGWPILKGARGRPPVDIEAIVGSITRIGQLAWENPEISEIDLNPFMVFPDGTTNVALDQVVVLSSPDEEDLTAMERVSRPSKPVKKQAKEKSEGEVKKTGKKTTARKPSKSKKK